MYDNVVASGSLPDMFIEAISEHNLEPSFFEGTFFMSGKNCFSKDQEDFCALLGF